MDVNEQNKCDKCGKKFRDERDLNRHLKRKTPCIVIAAEIKPKDANVCIHCNRVYSTKYNLTKHVDTCKMKNGGIDLLPEKNRIDEKLRIIIETQEKEKEEQKKKEEEQKKKDEKHSLEMEELRALIKEMLLRPPAAGTVNNAATVNNIGTQNNIVINNYNTPNIDHLLEFDNFRKMFGKYDADLPIELMLAIYFDPSHPENASIHLINKETKHIYAKVDDGWNTFKMTDITEKLRDIGYKYAAEAVRMHVNPEFPERRAYIMQKWPMIERFKHQKISPQVIKYENGLIEQKLDDEFIASSQHPAVIAEVHKKKREVLAAKNSCGV